MKNHYQLSIRQQIGLSLGLMAFFYPILLFINIKPENWGSALWKQLPLWGVEFLGGSAATFLFVVLAERMQDQLEKWYGMEALGFKRPVLNGSFLLAFLILGMGVSLMGTHTVRALTDDLLHLGNHAYPGSEEYIAHSMRAGAALFTTMALLIYILLLNRRIMKQTQIMQDRAEQLEKEQVLAQFNSLKTQVNPHFLFNSLSILSSLVQVDPDLSERFIDQLSRTYRYILEQRDQELVSLRTELDFITSYSFLLRIRFAEKFDLSIRVDEAEMDQYKIAPLTLQLLVENAVKHNRMSIQQPLLVEICAEDDILLVRNRMQPRPVATHSTGIGLQNIINRYALLSDRTVWAGESEEAFLVKVPLLT